MLIQENYSKIILKMYRIGIPRDSNLGQGLLTTFYFGMLRVNIVDKYVEIRQFRFTLNPIWRVINTWEETGVQEIIHRGAGLDIIYEKTHGLIANESFHR